MKVSLHQKWEFIFIKMGKSLASWQLLLAYQWL